MKAEVIFHHLNGHVAGALMHLEESRTRLQSLHHVAEDVSLGLVQAIGLTPGAAATLTKQLRAEVIALEAVAYQLRRGLVVAKCLRPVASGHGLTV